MSPTLSVEIPYVPRAWTLPVHEGLATHRFCVIVASRGSGKTYLTTNQLAAEALSHDDALMGPNGRYLFISPFLKQARDVAWVYLKEATRNVPGVQYQESLLQVRLPTGTWICLYGSDDPDALRGMHPHGVVMDEVADQRPVVWSEIVSPMLATHDAFAWFIGTPKGINLFSDIYYGALKKPDWYAGVFDVYKTGTFSPEEIEFQRSVKTERQFAQEFLCDFNAGSDSTLIPLDLAKKGAGRHVREDEYRHAAKLMGVDVARYGDDRTVIVKRQEVAMFPPLVYRGLDTGQVIDRIVRAADEWGPDAIFIDTGGSAGVYDGMKRMRWPVHGIDFGSSPLDRRYQNKRAEMACALRDWIQDGGAFPDDHEILADFCATGFDYKNARGKFSLESKEDMRARGLPSPDIFDAAMVTFAFPIAPRSMKFHAQRSGRVNDWNPLAPEYL